MIRFAFIFDSRGEMTDSLPSIFHPTPDLYDKYLRVFLPYQGVCCLRWSLTYYTSSIELNVIYMFVFEINVEFLLRKSSIDPCFFFNNGENETFLLFFIISFKTQIALFEAFNTGGPEWMKCFNWAKNSTRSRKMPGLSLGNNFFTWDVK